jgi:feruloyl esterase
MRILILAACASVVVVCPATAATCEQLTALNLPNARITAAETLSTGTFAKVENLPPFCRVAATLTPTSDSDIRMEVWMPAANWNGKFIGVGNGGLAGNIPYAAMGPLLARGFAVASSDTGHQVPGPNAAWALGHPEKQIDFGYRAVHESTVAAKAVVRAFYESGPRFSYFTGCSTGGRQALLEAQRYPEDYDGIVAGAPVNDYNKVGAQIMSIKDAADTIPPSKYATIHRAVMAA